MINKYNAVDLHVIDEYSTYSRIDLFTVVNILINARGNSE